MLNAYAFQFLDNCIDSKEKLANPDYVFKIPNVSTEVMEALVVWMIAHIGEYFLQ